MKFNKKQKAVILVSIILIIISLSFPYTSLSYQGAKAKQHYSFILNLDEDYRAINYSQFTAQVITIVIVTVGLILILEESR